MEEEFRQDELSDDELEAIVGGVPWETGKELAEKLREVKSTIIKSDVDKNGRLEGDEIKSAGLEGYVKTGENARKI